MGNKMEMDTYNEHSKNVKTFIYDWVLKEWNKLDQPEVWSDITRKTFSKKQGKMRLWKHECGKYYFIK